MTSIPALAGLRRLGHGQRTWRLLAYVGVVAAIFTAFVTSSHEPFRQQVLGETAGIQILPREWLLGGNLLPGASTTQRIEIRNPGSAALRYSLRGGSEAVGTPDLADALYLVLRTEADGCDRFNGPVLARGSARTFAMGDPAPGGQPGDRVLQGDRTERLCLRILLPLTTGDAFQGASTRFRVIVSAEGSPGR